jgi:hypothetical protein
MDELSQVWIVTGILVFLIVLLMLWVNFFWDNNVMTTYYKGKPTASGTGSTTPLYANNRQIVKVGELSSSLAGAHNLRTVAVNGREYHFIGLSDVLQEIHGGRVLIEDTTTIVLR